MRAAKISFFLENGNPAFLVLEFRLLVLESLSFIS